MHCGFIEQIKASVGHNLIEEHVIRAYRHPKQTPYDTVSITAFEGYPNLLPRVCVQPNRPEEYAKGPQYLRSYNPNILSKEYRQSRGFVYENPTPFTNYRDIFHHPHMTFDRFCPEDEITAWHLTMTAHDPTNRSLLRAYAQGQQAYLRIFKYAELLFKTDVEEEKKSGPGYKRKYSTLMSALKEAEKMEYEGKIKFTRTYPLQELTIRTQEIVDIIVQRSETPKRDLRIAKNRFAVARLGCGYWDTLSKEKQESIKRQVSFKKSQTMQRIEQASSFTSFLPLTGSGSFKRPRETGTEIVPATPTYVGMIPKRQRLLTEAVNDEIQHQNELTRQQNERREAARQRMQQQLEQEPEDVQEITEEDLIARFGNQVQLTESPVEPEMPSAMGLCVQDMMAAPSEMQIL